MNRTTFLLFSAAVTGGAFADAGPGDGNDFQGKRVLIIGIDGLRPDVLQAVKAPVMLGLAKAGTSSMKAVAGGELEGVTRQPTISGPGWATILTGTYANKHGVTGNSTEPGIYRQAAAPHFAVRLRESVPTASISSFASWGWIDSYLVAAQPGYFARHAQGSGDSYPERDDSAASLALECLKSDNPDVLFVHFDGVDGAGHGTGFSADNPDYVTAIERVDQLVGRVMNAVSERPQIAKEDWLVVITSDHGGIGHNHGGQTAEERTIPMIVAGRGSSGRGVVDEAPGQHVVAGTCLQFLGVPVQPAWGWEPGTFGLKP